MSLSSNLLSSPASPEADHYLKLAETQRLLGENELAASNYRNALQCEGNLAQAHMGLATLRLPGELYYERFYTWLSPKSVIEIGIADGASLARVRPPTVAIGVDPSPAASHPFQTETHIFAETSDAFFAHDGPAALLNGVPLGIGFIDGLHLYEQALRDFINLEAYSGPKSVILLHDTIPLDEATQSRIRVTQFHTGDVWKTVLCLKHYRTDLDIFTIATPWSGLTVVTGLNPTSRILSQQYDEAVNRFAQIPFSQIESEMNASLNVVPNDVSIVKARLKDGGLAVSIA
jgi:hypothetical protein